MLHLQSSIDVGRSDEMGWDGECGSVENLIARRQRKRRRLVAISVQYVFMCHVSLGQDGAAAVVVDAIF